MTAFRDQPKRSACPCSLSEGAAMLNRWLVVLPLASVSDWEMNRMSIPEPKVEHHEGRGVRSCPIFP
ncbi:MAG: hypothetical protein ACK57P_13115 [Planctomycetota bacterium]